MKHLFVLIFVLIQSALFGQSVNFTYITANDTYCVPVQVKFTQQSSSGATGYVWDFGDGSNSFSANPSHTYQASGTYNVQLTAIYKETAVKTSQTITIHPANQLQLSVDRDALCQPDDITFSTTANPQSEFQWDFDDGSTLSTNNSSITHQFEDFNTFTVNVTAVDGNGCEAKASKKITVKKPDGKVTFSSKNFCIDSSINFKSQINIPQGAHVASYTWNYGDGNNTTTTAGSVNHKYTDPGKYNGMLSIVTDEGCTGDIPIENVSVGILTSIQSAAPILDEVCASDSAVFEVASDDAYSYKWAYGDGSTSSGRATQVKHKYHQLGTKTVMVASLDQLGCAGDPVFFPIETIGVIASYDFEMNCSRREEFQFANTSDGNVTSFLWDFGDDVQNNTDNNLSHTFPGNATFNIKLQVDDSQTGCSDHITKKIATIPPAITNPDTVLCRLEPTTYKVSNANHNASTTYHYIVNDTTLSPGSSATLNYKPEKHGETEDYVIIDNGDGFCPDTTRLDHKILVKGPQLDFDLDASICTYDSTVVINHSSAFVPTDNITQWAWRADDSTYSSSFQPTAYHFTRTGNHNITLFATDIAGCEDSLQQSLVVNGVPFLRVIPQLDTLCMGQTDTLIAFHNIAINWTSNQTLDCTDCDTLVAAPQSDAYYAVESVSNAGCYARDTVQIRTYQPFDAAAANPINEICPGDEITLEVTPSDKIAQWTTDPASADLEGTSPVVSPIENTMYYVSMTDSAGCFSDTTSFDVRLKPTPLVDAGPDLQVAYNSPFQINPDYSDNITDYSWTPQNNLDCIYCAAPTGTALESHTYVVNATSDEGCIASDSVKVSIICDGNSLLLPNAFTPNNDQLNEHFYPVGRGVSIIKQFSVFDRYGQKIFSRENFIPNNKDLGWDGRIEGNPAPVAVYTYIVEAVCDLGDVISKKGIVTLLR